MSDNLRNGNGISSHFNFRVIIFFCLGLLFFEVSDTKSAETKFSRDELISGLGKFASSVIDAKSFYVDYEIKKAENFFPKRSNTASYESGYHLVLGRRGFDWYCFMEASQKPDHYSYDQYWILDSKSGARFNFSDTTTNSKHLSIRNNAVGYLYSWWYYTDNLFLDIYAFLPDPENKDYAKALTLNNPVADPLTFLYLPAAIKADPENYHLKPNLDKINGISCHILEKNGVDKIWIAAEKGFIPIRREMYFGPGRPEGMLWRVVTQHDLEEVRPGLWLPRKQIIEDYPDPKYDKDESIWGHLGCRREIQVKSMKFDSLTDDFFTLDVPVGTRVQDFVNDKQYIVRDISEDPFGSLVTVIKAEHSIQDKESPKNNTYIWLIVINSFVFVLLLAIFFRRYFKTDRNSR